MPRKRKIRFVEPASRPGRPFNAWVSRQPLLGPLLLATILDRQGYDAAVYNENLSGRLEENSEAYSDVCASDVVGISIMTPTAARGYELARRIRRDSPATRVVFGGIHATFASQEAQQYGHLVVRGEAESVIGPIAEGLIQEGVIDSPALENLDELPAPDYRLMRDFDRLLSQFPARGLYALPVMASRGCPYSCSFCSVSRMFGRRVRRRSVEKTFEDIRNYVEQGFREFFFYDDNFTSDRDWTLHLLQLLQPLNIRFWAQTRVDFAWRDHARHQLDRALLESMHKGGASTLYIGYETIDETTAAAWRKGYRGAGPLRERLLEDTRILHENGFWIHGMFVAGPKHTKKTVEEIVEFSREARLDSFHLSILTPLPGTPLFELMRPQLVFTNFPDDWDFYDGTHCVYYGAREDICVLQEAVLRAHRKFYRGYGWSLRRIRDVLGGRASLGARLRWAWSTAQTARRTLQEWERETQRFIEIATSRLSSYRPNLKPLPPTLSQ